MEREAVSDVYPYLQRYSSVATYAHSFSYPLRSGNKLFVSYHRHRD
jgi:hypothetical protein